MSDVQAFTERYLAIVEQCAGAAAKALRSRGDLSRAGSAAALGAATALLPAALARHRRRRQGALTAALDVLAKYGRHAALVRPRDELTLAAGAPEPSPRLGGLLGEEGPRAAEFLAQRSADPSAIVGRALALCAPLVLAAIAAAGGEADLDAWLTQRADAELADPALLLDEATFPGAAFRRIRARSFPWWSRVLR